MFSVYKKAHGATHNIVKNIFCYNDISLIFGLSNKDISSKIRVTFPLNMNSSL